MASADSLAAPTTTTAAETKPKPDRDVAVEALNHLVQGKRHLLVQDIPSAVKSLEEACRLLDACYGQLADECGEAYYNYGVALLESSRRESGVLGNGKDGAGSESGHDTNGEDDDDGDDDDEEKDDAGADDDDDDDEDDEKESADDDSKTTAPTQANAKQVDNVVVAEAWPKPTGDSDSKSENLEETQDADEGKEDKENSAPPLTSQGAESSAITLPETSSSVLPLPESSSSSAVAASSSASSSVVPMPSSSSSVDTVKPGTSSNNDATKENQKDEEDEEPSSLQLAWEVLEVAKVIFKRQTENNPDMMLNLARVQSKLGEVSMESENYKQSVDDLLECLAIQVSLLPADDRLIAETYYQLGLAYSYDLQYDRSIGNFKNATQVLNDRIKNLEKVVAEPDIEESQNEIKELKALISEVNDKIVDTDDMMKNVLKLPAALAEVIPLTSESPKKKQGETLGEVDSTTSSSQGAAKPASNIGHLVRKKRKTDDSEVSTSNAVAGESKRSRTEAGETTSNGHVGESGDASSTNGIIAMNAVHGETMNGSADSTATST